MKKILITCIVLLCIFSSKAQFRFGIDAGLLNTTNGPAQKLVGAPSYHPGNGFAAGGSVSYTLFRQLSGETGLAYQKRMMRYTAAAVADYGADFNYKLHYLSFTQNFMVMTRPIRGFSFGTGTGIFVARALNGTYSGTVTGIGGLSNKSGDLRFGNDEGDDFKKTDIGMNILVRSQYKNIRLTMQYSPSFSNNNPGENAYKYKFKCLTLCLGYTF